MKKLIIGILSLTLIVGAFALTACSGNAGAGSTTEKSAESSLTPTDFDPNEADEESEGTVMGGWTLAEDQNITDERLALFDKASGELVGAEYKAARYIGSQVVAGTNHCFLAEITPVIPDSEPHFSLVYIYEGLDGKVTVINTYDLDITSADEFDADMDIGEYCDYEAAAEKLEN